jgi:hypothetical protein
LFPTDLLSGSPAGSAANALADSSAEHNSESANAPLLFLMVLFLMVLFLMVLPEE